MEILEDRAAWEAAYRAGWLAHFERTGETDFRQYVRPKNRGTPSGPAVDLSRSRLLLVSSAGSYLPGQQEPFDAPNPLGDYSIRRIPSDTPPVALAFAHEHYDHAAVDADPQVLVPLGHLTELVAMGRIGALTPHMISFMGYQPDVGRVLDDLIPAIVDAARADGAQAALLVPS
jgi:Glycine/sarcosine/betaine reductase selenoprotein B (GRDB)